MNELKIGDMIEKKKMFVVWTLEIDALPPVVAIVDNGEVIGYFHEDDSELREPRRCERFFDTEKEANEYIQERINVLREYKKKVTDVLSEIYSYMDGYSENEDINVSAKTALDLQKGDEIQFICDLYEYDGTYQDTYMMGTPITIEESAAELVISDTPVNQNGSVVTYVFTDIYGAEHWTQALSR